MNTNQMHRLLTLVLASVLLTGCATVGRKVDQASVDRIKKGQTTQQEVIGLIGSPDQITRNADGDVIYSYIYVRATTKGESFIPIAGAFVGGTNVQNQMVMVTFGPDGIVKDVLSTYGATDSRMNASAGGRVEMNDVDQNKRPR